MNIIDFIGDSINIIIFAIFGILTAAAIIRSVAKAKKGKATSITPVGVFNELPESVTGIRKNKEWEKKEKID